MSLNILKLSTNLILIHMSFIHLCENQGNQCHHIENIMYSNIYSFDILQNYKTPTGAGYNNSNGAHNKSLAASNLSGSFEDRLQRVA